MRLRSIITLVIIIAVVCVVVFFGLAGFDVGLSTVRPVPEAVNLGLDLTGGAYVVYEAEQGELDADEFSGKMGTTMGVLRDRLDRAGFTEATVVAQSSDRIRVEVPINDTSDTQDPAEVLSLIGKPAVLVFRDMYGEDAITGDMVEGATTLAGERLDVGDAGLQGAGSGSCSASLVRAVR